MTQIRDRVRPMPPDHLEAMERDAESVIEDLRQTYLDVSRRNFDQLQGLIDNPTPHDDAWRTDIYRLAHDLKGQGSTFGHELVTRIAQGLCILIREGGSCNGPSFAKHATAHCEALRAVLDKDIRGDGGEHGQALLRILAIEG